MKGGAGSVDRTKGCIVIPEPRWDVGAEPCPVCGEKRLVYDGSVKWRSGARPGRALAIKGSLGSSPRADFEVAHYLHCDGCQTRCYDSIDGRKPHLTVERDQTAGENRQQTGWRPGSVGDVSARLGYDVRDLKMAGYSGDEIGEVLTGSISLDELFKRGPAGRSR